MKDILPVNVWYEYQAPNDSFVSFILINKTFEIEQLPFHKTCCEMNLKTTNLRLQLSHWGPLFTKMLSCMYRNSHYKPETVWWPSQVYNGNTYTKNIVSSSWIEALWPMNQLTKNTLSKAVLPGGSWAHQINLLRHWVNPPSPLSQLTQNTLSKAVPQVYHEPTEPTEPNESTYWAHWINLLSPWNQLTEPTESTYTEHTE